MIRGQLFAGVALLVGVAIGYFLKGDGNAPADVREAEHAKSAAISNRGDEASLKALRARIAELERMLAAKDVAVRDAQPSEDVKKDERRGPEGFRVEMERLRTEDPKKFAQMTNRFERMRAHRANRARSRMEFLSSIDTDGMTDEEKALHGKYMEALAKREALEERMHQQDLSDSDRHALMKEMFEMDREMRRMSGNERSMLIGKTAQAIGLSADDAAEVGATMNDIIRATNSDHHPGPPPDGGMPPPQRK